MSGDTAFRSYLLLTWRCWGSEVGELLKKRLWFEQSRHWHQWQNIQHFIPEIQGKSRWPPKGCKKRSLYDDDFSLDYLHVDACISEQHSCCRLLQIKTHNCLQMGYIITMQKIWYCLYSTFLLFIFTLIYMYIVFSKTRFFFSEYIRILLNYTLRRFWFEWSYDCVYNKKCF